LTNKFGLLAHLFAGASNPGAAPSDGSGGRAALGMPSPDPESSGAAKSQSLEPPREQWNIAKNVVPVCFGPQSAVRCQRMSNPNFNPR
jgi:hypothetical protein